MKQRRTPPALIAQEDYFLVDLGNGRYAKVCTCHAHLIKDRVWGRLTVGYACNRALGVMHRVVSDARKGFEVDHRNGDKLDNRCVNLRICTSGQNKMNIGKRSQNTSGYKGVYWHGIAKRWMASITYRKKSIYLGLFDLKEDAATAYNQKARELFGEFAYPNIIK